MRDAGRPEIGSWSGDGVWWGRAAASDEAEGLERDILIGGMLVVWIALAGQGWGDVGYWVVRWSPV